jgi:hypothetical protein
VNREPPEFMSRQTLKVLGAASLLSSLVFVAAAATHVLGRAVLDSVVGLVGAILLLGVS